jgi:hypothetical protein
VLVFSNTSIIVFHRACSNNCTMKLLVEQPRVNTLKRVNPLSASRDQHPCASAADIPSDNRRVRIKDSGFYHGVRPLALSSAKRASCTRQLSAKQSRVFGRPARHTKRPCCAQDLRSRLRTSLHRTMRDGSPGRTDAMWPSCPMTSCASAMPVAGSTSD